VTWSASIHGRQLRTGCGSGGGTKVICPQCSSQMKRLLPPNGGVPWICSFCDYQEPVPCKHDMVMRQSPVGVRTNECTKCGVWYPHPSSGTLKCASCGGMVRETFSGVMCLICHMKIIAAKLKKAKAVAYPFHPKLVPSADKIHLVPAPKFAPVSKPQTITVVVPVQKPKTEGRKFR
jgi:predicted nucleic acid-binding Zn ribbon protein